MKNQLFTKASILRGLLSLFFLMIGVSGAWAETKSVSKSIGDIVSENEYQVSSGPDINTKALSIDLDENINVSIAVKAEASGNTGSFWGSTTIDWRLYQNDAPSITLRANNNATLNAVKITYNISNSGILNSYGTGQNIESGYQISSGRSYSVSGTSVTYYVGNTSTKTNGQARITNIEVQYTINESGTTHDPISYTVNIANDIANGTVTATPTSATVGQVITLTATPALGYEFGSWNVTNASTSEAIAIADNKFTMPAANVNVSAIFNEAFDGIITTMSAADDAGIKFVSGSSSATSAFWANSKPLSANGISLSGSNGSSSNYSYYDGSVVRFYQNNSFTLTPASGITIVKVEIVRQSTTGSNSGTINCSGLTASSNNTTTNTNVYTGSATSAVTFTATAQARFTKILVYTTSGETKNIQSIAVSGSPNKTTYEVGDAFDPAGLVVKANYRDKSSETISEDIEWIFDYGTGNDAFVAGATSVDVVACVGNVMSEVYRVEGLTVKDPVSLSSISVSGTPAKTSYYVGDAFDPAGLVVTGIYSDGSKETITEGIEWSIDPETLTLGITSVDVMASVGSVVSEVYTVDGLTVAENPYKTEIYTFTEFISAQSVELTDLDGFTITLVKGESSSSNPAWSSSQARVYAGGSLTVKANNAVIKSIAFNYVVNANKNGVSPTIDGVKGTTTAGTWNSESNTWTGSDSKVTFSTSGSAGNVGFTSLKITYKQGSKTESSLEWSSASAEVTMGADDNVFPTLRKTPEDLAGISYESNNVAVATISADGTITLVAPGETTITARYAGNDDYTAASASYVLTVNKAPHILTPASEGFESVDFASMYSSVTTNATVEDFEGTSFNLVFAKPESSSTPTKYYNNGKAVRAYTGNTITITAAEDIMAVVVNYVNDYVDDGQTITGLGTTTAVITFSKTCRFTSITVYYRGYTRAMSLDKGQTKWGTICLPNSVLAATITGAEFYSVLGVTKKADEVTGIVLEKVETDLVAGMPYLFKATGNLFCAYIGDAVLEPVSATGLVGNFSGNLPVPAGCYILSSNKIRMVQEGAEAYAGPNRAYINLDGVGEYDGSAANALRFGFDGEVEDYTTYIQTIQYDAEVEIFDLLGNKVQTMKKGQLYIVNGKKMFNK